MKKIAPNLQPDAMEKKQIRALRAALFLSNITIEGTHNWMSESLTVNKLIYLNHMSAIHCFRIRHHSETLDRIKPFSASLVANSRLRWLSLDIRNTELEPYIDMLPKLRSLCEVRINAELGPRNRRLDGLIRILGERTSAAINLTKLTLTMYDYADPTAVQVLGKVLLAATGSLSLRTFGLLGAKLAGVESEFAGFLRGAEFLHSLMLTDVFCPRTSVKLISSALMETKAKSLSLHYSGYMMKQLDGKDCTLAKCLEKNVALTRLRLEGVNVEDPSDEGMLVASFSGSLALERVEVRKSTFMSQKHVSAISQLKNLKILRFKGTPMGPESLMILLTGLQECRQPLEVLALDLIILASAETGPHKDAALRKERVLALCSGVAGLLAKTRTLVNLSLRTNKLTDADVETMKDGIRQNGSLQELDLAENDLVGDQIDGFAAAVAVHPLLQRIVLDDNKITQQGGSKLVNSLLKTPSMKTVSLMQNVFGVEKVREEATKASAHFCVNVSLEYIGLRRRMAKELKVLSAEKLDFIERLDPGGENSTEWTCAVRGPKGTPYEGGIFTISIVFPSNYPFWPPKVRILTRIYHLNVGTGGYLDMDILCNAWSPALTIQKVLITIMARLSEYDTECVSDFSALELFKTNRPEYERIAREQTKKYAS